MPFAIWSVAHLPPSDTGQIDNMNKSVPSGFHRSGSWLVCQEAFQDSVEQILLFQM
jgi:hypothetical protein